MKKELEEAKQYLELVTSSWNGEDATGTLEGRPVIWEDEINEAEAKIKELEAQGERLVEVARSFSFKLNVGNYESRDFFCSQKAECKWIDAEDVSESLYQFCKAQVIKDVNGYKSALNDLKNERSSKIAKKQETKDDAETDLSLSAVEE